MHGPIRIRHTYISTYTIYIDYTYVQWRTEGGGVWVFQPPPSKFRRPSKIVPNSTRLWKLLKIAEFRTPTPQDLREKSSKIKKTTSVRNCFTLAMTNKSAVFINSLTIPKFRKFYYMKWSFLYQITAASRTPDKGLPPPDPRSLCPLSSTELNSPPLPPNKLPGYATAYVHKYIKCLILILLTWRIWWAPNNASKLHIGFNSAFKCLNWMHSYKIIPYTYSSVDVFLLPDQLTDFCKI